MSNIVKLAPKGAFESTSEKVLQDSIDMDFDTVIVFGYKGERVHIKTSGVKSNLELIGALEAAKQQVWGSA